MHKRKFEYHQRATFSRTQPISWLGNPIVIGICILLTLIFGYSYIKTLDQLRLSHNKLQEAQNMVNKEEERQRDLQEKLRSANDPLTREQIIRDELNMQKPGETVLQLPTPTP